MRNINEWMEAHPGQIKPLSHRPAFNPRNRQTMQPIRLEPRACSQIRATKSVGRVEQADRVITVLTDCPNESETHTF
jgi:hypothetical protein